MRTRDDESADPELRDGWQSPQREASFPVQLGRVRAGKIEPLFELVRVVDTKDRAGHDVAVYREMHTGRSEPERFAAKFFERHEHSAAECELRWLRSLVGSTAALRYETNVKLALMGEHTAYLTPEERGGTWVLTAWMPHETLLDVLSDRAAAFTAVALMPLVDALITAHLALLSDKCAPKDTALENLFITGPGDKRWPETNDVSIVHGDFESAAFPAADDYGGGRVHYRPPDAGTYNAGQHSVYALGLVVAELRLGTRVYDLGETPETVKETVLSHAGRGRGSKDPVERSYWHAVRVLLEAADPGADPDLALRDARNIVRSGGDGAKVESRRIWWRAHRLRIPAAASAAFLSAFGGVVLIHGLAQPQQSQGHGPGAGGGGPTVSTPGKVAQHRATYGGHTPEAAPGATRNLTKFAYRRGAAGDVENCRRALHVPRTMMADVTCHEYGITVHYVRFHTRTATRKYFQRVMGGARLAYGRWGTCANHQHVAARATTSNSWHRTDIGGQRLSGPSAFLYHRRQALLTWEYPKQHIVAVAAGKRDQLPAICSAWKYDA